MTTLWCDITKGRVQKFLLNRLVEFSIKWVGGYHWSTKENDVTNDIRKVGGVEVS